MKFNFVILAIASFTFLSCKSTQETSSDMTHQAKDRIEFTVTKIQNEMDGQTIHMEDDEQGKYTMIISPANGNWVDLEVGDRISLIAEALMESYPVQVIAKDIEIIEREAIQVIISSDKSNYKIGEPVMLSMVIKNTATKPFTFLPWQTPLEERMTGDFMKVTHNEHNVPYTGIMVKRMPPTEDDYITIPVGESVKGEINLLQGYKLESPGVYQLQFKEMYDGLPSSNAIEVRVEE